MIVAGRPEGTSVSFGFCRLKDKWNSPQVVTRAKHNIAKNSRITLLYDLQGQPQICNTYILKSMLQKCKTASIVFAAA